MNLGLQKYVLQRVIKKNYRERGLSQELLDEILESAWEDQIDPDIELGENISLLSALKSSFNQKWSD